MVSLRPVVSAVLLMLVTVGGVGCKKNESAQAKPEPSASTNPRGKLGMRPPIAPQARMDPQTTKDYRVELCEFGTLTLRYARDQYMASLGKDEPSEKKLPSFGSSGAAGPTPPGAPPVPPGAPGAPGAPKPGASAGPGPAASAGAGPGKDRRPFDMSLRVSHERNARACTVAAGLKDPAMGDVDAALAAFAPYAVELAKDIATAQTYYQREEYKKDSFAKGKELHKKLVGEFPKFDELHGKLVTAFEAWRKDHPADTSKMEDGEKLASAAYDDARAAMLAAMPKKPDKEGFKTNVGKLEKSSDALKAFGTTNAADNWSKIVSGPLDLFLKTAKEGQPKVVDKGVDSEVFLNLVNNFYGVIEAKNRGIQRSLVLKAQAQAAASGAAPGAPVPPPVAPPPDQQPH